MNAEDVEVRAVVLVGGQGARMGFPKSLLRAGDAYLLPRIVAVAQSVAREAVLAGSAPVPEGLEKVRRLEDARGLRGPLAGLLAAFRDRGSCAWLALPCDAPFITGDALSWLIAQARPGTVAVMPRLSPDGAAEPLPGLYMPAAAPLLERGAREGDWSAQRILAAAKVASPRVPSRLRRAWINVNTPDDCRKARMNERVA